jgi:hypothetical protein
MAITSARSSSLNTQNAPIMNWATAGSRSCGSNAKPTGAWWPTSIAAGTSAPRTRLPRRLAISWRRAWPSTFTTLIATDEAALDAMLLLQHSLDMQGMFDAGSEDQAGLPIVRLAPSSTTRPVQTGAHHCLCSLFVMLQYSFLPQTCVQIVWARRSTCFRISSICSAVKPGCSSRSRYLS